MATKESSARTTREQRGLEIARTCFEEIAASYRRGTYTVPSHSTPGRSYRVRYSRREESCECKDWQFGHICMHIYAAAMVAAKSDVCEGCGRRVRHSELHEVVDSLTFYEGMVICADCAQCTASEVL